jgi:acetyl coenzyme A synthetase (ADP forming)-like protein
VPDVGPTQGRFGLKAGVLDFLGYYHMFTQVPGRPRNVPTLTGANVARPQLQKPPATTVSLSPFFRPRAVAVIGPSRNPGGIGRLVLDAIVRGGFPGPVYAINPNAAEVGGVRAYPRLSDLPGPVDLAIVAVPRDAVPAVVDDCAAGNVRALLVISAGFAEVGAAGRELQARLVDQVRGYGMRMIGPNCMGLVNADPAVRLFATFAAVSPPPGRMALASQSGAVGLALLAVAGRLGLGLSSFVSLGNKADVSTNDLLQYWEEDEGTDVVLLYLESFGNPRRFGRIARRIGRRKPVVALHSGRTPAGGRAAGSHTAALATNGVAVDALFRQTGVVRAGTLEELFDLAALLGGQPLPPGRRVGVVTNAGGPAILCADACEAGGLTLPEFSQPLKARLARFLTDAASLTNPVDLIASATPDQYRRAVEAVLGSGEVDGLVVIHAVVRPAATQTYAEAVGAGVVTARAAGANQRTVIACWLAEDHPAARSALAAERIPCYAFPESAARALSQAAAYAEWRGRPEGVVPDFDDLDLASARTICRRSLEKHGAGWLSAADARSVLGAVRLPVAPGGVAGTADEAVALARSVGFPVAVKLADRRVIHKTEVGGVRLALADADAVRRAFADVRARAALAGDPPPGDGVVVQPMLNGVELMAGVTEDRRFGPLVAFGLGGVHVEVLADVCFRVTPLTDRDAAEMVRSVRGFRLLEGYRGHPAADVAAVEELLLRLARLAEELPEIDELDLNPIFAMPPGQGCRVADVRVRVRETG